MENKVAEAILDALTDYYEQFAEKEGYPQSHEQIAIINKELSAIQNEWVDEREALPNNDTRCAVYDGKVVLYDAWYYPEDKEWWWGGKLIPLVTHWIKIEEFSPPTKQ